MAKTLLYITNIPTPYRNFRFNLLARVCQTNGFHLRVLYMNESEPDRAWTLNKKDMRHDFIIFSHNKVKQTLGMWLHFCPKLHLYLLRVPYCVAILGGLASPAHFVASLVLKPSKLNVLSVESNLSSIGNHSGLANKVKTFLMRRFQFFQVTGTKAAEFIRHYVPDAKTSHMVTLPNVINEPLFDFIEAESIPVAIEKQINARRELGHKIVLIPARLIEEKGLFPFLEAVKHSDPLTILIAGEGPLRASLEAFVTQHGLDVILLGAQSPQVTAALMKNADVLCLPSRSDPSPLSVIEACACGLPILVSNNIGNVDEVFANNGWRFNFGDAVSTRKAVESMLKADRTVIQAMSQASKALFESRFRAEIVLQAYIEQLQRLEAV
jgi:glycosyltransferase involved in cell wall biosynthesis